MPYYRRGTATKASCDIVREGTITFDPPGLSVAIADFFAEFFESGGFE